MRTKNRTIATIVAGAAVLTPAAPAGAEARYCKRLASELHVAQVRVARTDCRTAARVLRQARRASRRWRPGAVTALGWRCRVSYTRGEFVPDHDLHVDCRAGRGRIWLTDAGSGW